MLHYRQRNHGKRLSSNISRKVDAQSHPQKVQKTRPSAQELRTLLYNWLEIQSDWGQGKDKRQRYWQEEQSVLSAGLQGLSHKHLTQVLLYSWTTSKLQLPFLHMCHLRSSSWSSSTRYRPGIPRYCVVRWRLRRWRWLSLAQKKIDWQSHQSTTIRVSPWCCKKRRNAEGYTKFLILLRWNLYFR